MSPHPQQVQIMAAGKADFPDLAPLIFSTYFFCRYSCSKSDFNLTEKEKTHASQSSACIKEEGQRNVVSPKRRLQHRQRNFDVIES